MQARKPAYRDDVEEAHSSSALRTIATERDGLDALARALEGELGQSFARTVDLIRAGRARVVITGMGKSGHVGRKIAATLASTGTPAFFVHPGEASHGDLGMIGSDDVVIALSWSGETRELADIIDYASRFGVALVAMTASAESSLGRAADICLVLPRVEEACPHGLAPTTSSMMQLALGDALAVALLERRGFSASDFALFHPGGKLGSQLLRVEQLMHKGDELPLVGPDCPMVEAVLQMSDKRLGCVGVVEGGRLVGIVTDGDLRRHMAPDLFERPVRELMTPRPRTIDRRALAVEALATMNGGGRPVTVLFVVEDGRPVGALHLHDCLKAGIV
jgi:arabinose-5-phosphate isomerase